MIQKRTIGIVGTGQVGMAAGYAIFLRGLVSEIILIDKDRRAPAPPPQPAHPPAHRAPALRQRR